MRPGKISGLFLNGCQIQSATPGGRRYTFADPHDFEGGLIVFDHLRIGDEVVFTPVKAHAEHVFLTLSGADALMTTPVPEGSAA